MTNLLQTNRNRVPSKGMPRNKFINLGAVISLLTQGVGIDLGSVWDRFGIDLESVWDGFGIGLGWIWDRCGIDVGSILGVGPHK